MKLYSYKQINLDDKKSFQRICLSLFLLIFLGNLIFYQNDLTKAPADSPHTWLTGSTIKFVQNWLENGACTLGYRMYEWPASIESPVPDMGLYVSYPPGCLIPIYYIAKIGTLIKGQPFSTDDLVVIVKVYSLFLKSIIALCLFGILFLFFKKNTSKINAFIMGCIGILFFHSFNFSNYYHCNVYFSDQAVLVFFAISILLEIIRNNSDSDETRKKRLNIAILIVNTLGAFTDWLFFFYIFIIFIQRVISGDFGKFGSIKFFLKAAVFSLPIVIVAAIFLIQILSVTNFDNLIFKFKYRTTDYHELGKNPLAIYYRHITKGFGFFAGYLFFISLFFYIYKVAQAIRAHKRDYFVDFYSILLLPCLFQILFFSAHSAQHEFSMVKLELPIVFFMMTFPFEIAKIIKKESISSEIFNSVHIKNKQRPFFFIYLALILLIVNIASSAPTYYRIGKDYLYENERFVQKNATYNDVIFSLDYEIFGFPPKIAYSRKCVYKIDNIEQIDIFVKRRKLHNANFLVFTAKNSEFKYSSTMKLIAVDKEKALYLYKKSK